MNTHINGAVECSFCGESKKNVAYVVTSTTGATICSKCLEEITKIRAESPPRPDIPSLFRRLLGDLIEYAIERGQTLERFQATLRFLELELDDHARNVVANSCLRRN